MNIGTPTVTFLNTHIRKSRKKYDISITSKLKEYDFFRVDFAFSPIEFDGMAFSSANFLVDLDSIKSEASIIQLHPERINHETQMECQYGITGSFSYELIKDTEHSVEGKYLRTKKYTRLHTHILAFGLGRTESRWEYRTTQSVATIVGVHEMEMHVRQKRNTKTPGLIQIGTLQIRYKDFQSWLKDLWLKITSKETTKSSKKEAASKENHTFMIEKK